jgi:hypothetical protein
VTGVLDWPGFAIADPVMDVAATVTLVATSAKHLLHIEQWEQIIQMYLEAYRAARPLDLTHLDYHRARRCVVALTDGADGQAIWRQPEVVADLLALIHEITGVRVAPQFDE